MPESVQHDIIDIILVGGTGRTNNLSHWES